MRKQRRLVTVADCTVELTALEVSGQSWTTLGFEAPDGRALDRAVERFFASVELPGDGLSCGYPGWLATL